MKLLYHRVLVSLHSHILKDLTDESIKQNSDAFDKVFDATWEAIKTHDKLRFGMTFLNYSWASSDCICYNTITHLFVIYNIGRIRLKVTTSDVNEVSDLAVQILQNLESINSKGCRFYIEHLRSFQKKLVDLMQRETTYEFNIDNFFDNTEFMNSVLGTINSLEFDFLA